MTIGGESGSQMRRSGCFAAEPGIRQDLRFFDVERDLRCLPARRGLLEGVAKRRVERELDGGHGVTLAAPQLTRIAPHVLLPISAK